LGILELDGVAALPVIVLGSNEMGLVATNVSEWRAQWVEVTDDTATASGMHGHQVSSINTNFNTLIVSRSWHFALTINKCLDIFDKALIRKRRVLSMFQPLLNMEGMLKVMDSCCVIYGIPHQFH
jgi:hypothetical protein